VGYFRHPKKVFLVERNGWDRKIHNISDSGKVAQGHQPSCQLIIVDSFDNPIEQTAATNATHNRISWESHVDEGSRGGNWSTISDTTVATPFQISG
jgi:hypothetical protein